MNAPSSVARSPALPDPGVRDVLIAGGGPAGSVAAATLARRGLHVLVLDRDTFPRDKLCGEFLSGECLLRLEELGALASILALEPPRISCARFTAPSGAALRLPLPTGGIGISRQALDAILVATAREHGAEVAERTVVRSVDEECQLESRGRAGAVIARADHRGVPGVKTVTYEARAGIIACGRGSTIASRVEDESRKRSAPRARYIGFKRHHVPASGDARATPADLSGCVEVHTFRGGYCGVAEIEGGRVNACFLAKERWIRDEGIRTWDEIVRAAASSSRPLAHRFETLDALDEPTLTTAGVSLRPRPRSQGSWVLIGDAAGMVAPFAGDGQAMAIESGVLAGTLIATLLRSEAPVEARALARLWDREWKRAFCRPLLIGRLVQRILLRPEALRAGLAAASFFPPVARAIARSTRLRRR